MSALSQQLDRFQEAYRYHGKVPVRELSFEVCVWRSLLIDEEQRQLVCQCRIAMSTKYPSPAEQLNDLQQWIRYQAKRPADELGAPQTAENPPTSSQQQQQQNAQGSGDVEMQQRGSPTLPPTERSMTSELHPLLRHLQQMREQYAVDVLRSGVTAASAPPQQPPTLTLMDALRHYMDQERIRFFTRPPAEDFTDPTEFVSPIEPEQQTSPLASILLTHHRTVHRGNPNLYLMFALGQLVHVPHGRDAILGDASRSNRGDLPYELCDVRWQGEEAVFCTISFSPNSDTSFLAKPSLNVEHTLMVATPYLYTFKVTVVDNASAVPPAHSPAPGVATTAAAEVGRLVNAGAQRQQEPSPQQALALVTDASERERRILLRQAVLKGRASRSATRSPSLPGKSPRAFVEFPEVIFTPPPPSGDGTAASPPMRRVHIFGTLERIVGVTVDSLYAKLRWFLPEGAVIDTATNAKTGADSPLVIVSQLSFGCRIINRDYEYETLHALNVPFELHLLVPEHLQRHVSLAVTLYSRGSGGADHSSPAGYGHAWVTTCAAQQREDAVPLWNVRPTGYEYLRQVFLGGGPALAEDEFIGFPPATARSSVQSKLGLLCESSGVMHLRYFVVVHERVSAHAASTVASGGGLGSNPSVAVHGPTTLVGEGRSAKRASLFTNAGRLNRSGRNASLLLTGGEGAKSSPAVTPEGGSATS